MKYCIKCGSELKGAKQFCIVCGARQDKKAKDVRLGNESKQARPEQAVKKSKTKSGTCFRCGDETEKKCFFCDQFVCRDHYIRMQANAHSYDQYLGLKNQGEKKAINEGWRGFIIPACARCASMKHTKAMTNEELDEVNLVVNCTWYKLD